jgi:hypothetical protein
MSAESLKLTCSSVPVYSFNRLFSENWGNRLLRNTSKLSQCMLSRLRSGYYSAVFSEAFMHSFFFTKTRNYLFAFSLNSQKEKILLRIKLLFFGEFLFSVGLTIAIQTRWLICLRLVEKRGFPLILTGWMMCRIGFSKYWQIIYQLRLIFFYVI